MITLKKIANFIFWSSSDPEKIALTIKGAVVFIPTILTVLSVFGFSITPETLTQLIFESAALVSGGVIVFGAMRKLFLTFKNRQV